LIASEARLVVDLRNATAPFATPNGRVWKL
jgi:hypothetical protein